MTHLTRFAVFVFIALSTQFAQASLIVDAAAILSGPNQATAADFITNDAAIDSGTVVNQLNNVSGGLALGLDWANQSFSFDGLTLVTGGGRLPIGRAGDAGSLAGVTPYTQDTPILGGSAFTREADLTLDVLGLASLPHGTNVVLTIYGIGDNVGQDTGFVSTFANASTLQETVYNTTGDRSDDTGSVPFVQFTYVADGLNDTVAVVTQAATNPLNDPLRQFINGFSVSVTEPVPEPSSAGLLSLITLGIALRRRR